MNKVLLSIVITFFSLLSTAQTLTKQQDIIELEQLYVSDIKCSPKQNYYSYNTGWVRTTILNKEFKEIASFELNPMWGGGISDFSHNDSFYFFTKNGEPDTLVIYKLISGETLHLPTNVATLKSFNTQNKVLLMHNGKFTVYIPENNSFIKTNIDVGSKPNEFFSNYDIDAKDSLLYASTLRNTINIYNLSNYKKVESIDFKFPDEIDLVKVIDNGKKLVCTSNNTIYFVNLANGEVEESIEVDFQYISGIKFIETEQLVIIGGIKNNGENQSAIYTFHIPTKKLEKNAVLLKGEGVYGLEINNTGVLISDYKIISQYIVK